MISEVRVKKIDLFEGSLGQIYTIYAEMYEKMNTDIPSYEEFEKTSAREGSENDLQRFKEIKTIYSEAIVSLKEKKQFHNINPLFSSVVILYI
jgi:hypothetical protein